MGNKGGDGEKRFKGEEGEQRGGELAGRGEDEGGEMGVSGEGKEAHMGGGEGKGGERGT